MKYKYFFLFILFFSSCTWISKKSFGKSKSVEIFIQKDEAYRYTVWVKSKKDHSSRGVKLEEKTLGDTNYMYSKLEKVGAYESISIGSIPLDTTGFIKIKKGNTITYPSGSFFIDTPSFFSGHRLFFHCYDYYQVWELTVK